MEIKIQSIHFDATEKLQAFIEKKVAKLEKAFEDIQKVEIQCKLVKPATAQNKEVSMSVAVPGTYRPLRGLNEGSTAEIQGKIA